MFNLRVSAKDFTSSESEQYVLEFADTSSVEEPNKDNLFITILPQDLQEVTAVHYAFTERVSQIANVTNTSIVSEDNNYGFAYSFTDEPSSTIIAGTEGLFVIDIDPYYANVQSVLLRVTSSRSGSDLGITQLVTTKDGAYYIIGKPVERTASGDIKLALISKAKNASITQNNNSSTLSIEGGNIEYEEFGGIAGSSVGRLYIKTSAPSSLTSNDSFELDVIVEYLSTTVDGSGNVSTELKTAHLYPRPYELKVENPFGFSLTTSRDGVEREVIAKTDSSQEPDYLDITTQIEQGYTLESMTITNQNKAYIETTSSYKRLYLNNSAAVGDEIVIRSIVSIMHNGQKEVSEYLYSIRVVDLVITGVSIDGLDNDDNLSLEFSVNKAVSIIVNGYGTESAKGNAQEYLSRAIASQNSGELADSILFLKVLDSTSNQYVSIDTEGLNVPFTVSKTRIMNSENNFVVKANDIGAKSDYSFSTYSSNIYLIGGNQSASASMKIEFKYVYSTSSSSKGKIIFMPYSFDADYGISQEFTLTAREGISTQNYEPINSERAFLSMTSGHSYILTNDITITAHKAKTANFVEFDGNNHVITIEGFQYDTVESSTSSNSISLGLFDTVEAGTTIKNLIVAFEDNHSTPTNLSIYSDVKFGGIAAVNKGVITNCDVITRLLSAIRLYQPCFRQPVLWSRRQFRPDRRICQCGLGCLQHHQQWKFASMADPYSRRVVLSSDGKRDTIGYPFRKGYCGRS